MKILTIAVAFVLILAGPFLIIESMKFLGYASYSLNTFIATGWTLAWTGIAAVAWFTPEGEQR